MPSSLSPRRRLLLGAVLLVTAALLAGSVPGTSPPSVCAVCDDRMEAAAAERGANVSVTHGETHLYVRPDGSARWEMRVTLEGDGVEAFRTNASFRRQLVDRRLRENGGPAPSEPQNLTTAMDGRTFLVRFDDPSPGDRHVGGVVLVDTFHHQTDEAVPAPFTLAADRMVLHPPDGWTVLNEVPGADRGGETVVWRQQIDERTYVALGPTDAVTTRAAGEVAVATAVAGWATGPVLWASVVPVALLVAGLGAAYRHVDDRAAGKPGDGVDR